MSRIGVVATVVCCVGLFPWAPTALHASDTEMIVFQSGSDGDSEIFVMDPDGGNQRQLTDNKAEDFNPRWSPDARQICSIRSLHPTAGV